MNEYLSMKLVMLGVISLLNIGTPIVTGEGGLLNMALGILGMIVLYVLRNNIEYNINFSNKKKKDEEDA